MGMGNARNVVGSFQCSGSTAFPLILFWKKESRDGGEIWVAAKETDEDALKRW